jgi:DNA-binding transcriptional LysR family regulator
MDLTQIRHFLALADALNFTRAAERCNITQPAFTRSVQRLEDELGGPLVLRERALTQLTELGRAMLPLLQGTHDAAEAVRARAADHRRAEDAAPLRLGLAPSVPTAALLPALREAARRVQGLELTCGGTPSPRWRRRCSAANSTPPCCRRRRRCRSG